MNARCGTSTKWVLPERSRNIGLQSHSVPELAWWDRPSTTRRSAPYRMQLGRSLNCGKSLPVGSLRGRQARSWKGAAGGPFSWAAFSSEWQLKLRSLPAAVPRRWCKPPLFFPLVDYPQSWPQLRCRFQGLRSPDFPLKNCYLEEKGAAPHRWTRCLSASASSSYFRTEARIH